MKKKVILLVIILLLISGCKIKEKKKVDSSILEPIGTVYGEGYFKAIDKNFVHFDEFMILAQKKEGCSNEVVEYYKFDNKKVFLVCLEDVRVGELYAMYPNDETDVVKTLKYLLKKDTGADYILKFLIEDMDVVKKSGNNKLYRKESVTIISCNDKYYYLGDDSLNDLNKYCKIKK